MKAYHGFFKKKNGSLREMLFAELDSLPDSYIDKRIIGTGVEKTYPEGMSLVWDLEQDDFRIFNWKTSQGVKEVEVDETQYLKSS